MRMRKLILSIFILFLVIILMANTVSLADTDAQVEKAIEAMEGMKGGGVVDGAVSGKLKTVVNSILAIIQVVGTGIALIMVTVFGIRYIMASPNDKADVKKQILPMLVGAVLLFAGVNIIQIVADLTDSTLSSL